MSGAPAGWRRTDCGCLEREIDGRWLQAGGRTAQGPVPVGFEDSEWAYFDLDAAAAEAAAAAEVDRRWPVSEAARQAWTERHRMALQARIEQAEGALSEATERAEDARRRLWLLRADLAALGGGA